MNWGTELWDQYDNLAAHTHKGIEFLDKYGNFVKDRCAIELEYAGKLRRLVKSYQPKRKEEDEYQYSACKAFRQLLQELGDFAGQREVVAENLQSNVVRELHLLAKELREERKQHLSEGAKQVAVLNSAIGALERARRAYERAARESERALETFQKADADLNLSRAELEKQKANVKARSQACEEAKQEYTDQLRKTNEAQRQHYEQRLPHVFKQLQDLDEKRIKNIKNFMLSSVDVERKVFPIIMQCLEGMEQAANSINEKEDTQLVIERYKSGFAPPEEFRFEAMSGAEVAEVVPQNHLTAARGTVSGHRIKKRGGLLSIFSSNKRIIEACNSFKNNMSMDGKEDYSDLPPNQKKKKLQAKVHELNKQVGQEQAAMEGLMKMKGVYETNPTLGDPMTVEGQLNECCDKLKKLRAQLRKYEELLAEANSQLCAPPIHPVSRTNGSAPPAQAISIGSNSESLSRSASESSPDLQPLGYCKALYAFEANGTGSTMRMECGERLLVLETDAGDGWTRVRRHHTREEGFVPTTYIATTLYADAHEH
ncbi:unnamed protein product [Parnassius apollo]|uniref:(apollo) hypothetical protein n=1 Tax=Parnassius apollo TaxID=110799 RepID=A0A8S3XV73_PARAO|nr:unnamed protein product [Parnassius apollo]